MAENKTKQTRASAATFLNGIKDPAQKRDSKQLARLMQEVTKLPPKMWGAAMVGFGSVHYRYASGREGDIFLLGFAPRKGTLVIYGCGKAFDPKLMAALGEHDTGKGCLYIKRLEDVRLPVLKKLLQRTVKVAKTK
jgi:hypothetical protein